MCHLSYTWPVASWKRTNAFAVFLVVCSEMTCKTSLMSVCPCGVNIFKSLRLWNCWAEDEVDETWHLYSMGCETKLLGSGILNFGSCTCTMRGATPNLARSGEIPTPSVMLFVYLLYCCIMLLNDANVWLKSSLVTCMLDRRQEMQQLRGVKRPHDVVVPGWPAESKRQAVSSDYAPNAARFA